MSEDNVNAVRSAYEFYRRKDIPAFFDLLHPQVEFYQSDLVPWGGHYRGHDQVQDFFGKLIGHIDSIVDTEEFVEAGDHVVVIGRSRGRVKGNARDFDVRTVHVWRMRNGKAMGLQVYLDTPKMLEALEA